MWALAAAETLQEGSNQLIVAVFVFLGVVVTAVGGIIVALVNSRLDRTSSSPPSPAATHVADKDLNGLCRDLAVLQYRADDKDSQMDVIDRHVDELGRKVDRLEYLVEKIERYLEDHSERWRSESRRKHGPPE